MKRLFLGTVLAAGLALAVPAAASAEYDTFVGCDDLAEFPVPSHACQIGDFPGAYFESDEEVEYEICVEFPGGSELCLDEQVAEAETLYVNSITSEMPGDHFVSWFVGPDEVGSWDFRMDLPPAPPAPPAPAPIPLPAPPVLPAIAAPSPACVKGKKQVTQFRNKLQSTNGRKAKAKVRGKLKGAKATVNRAC